MDKNTINRKIKLLRSGFNETEVANILGIQRQAVNAEMHGTKKSRRIRELLCKLTKTTPEQFFPEHVKKVANENGVPNKT